MAEQANPPKCPCGKPWLSGRRGWALLSLFSLMGMLGMGLYALSLSRSVPMQVQSMALRVAARSAAVLLSREVFERSREIDLLRRSAPFLEGDLSRPEVRRALELRRATHDEYLWLGVANPQGQVVQATGGLLLGESVVARPWFAGARQGPYLGNVHEAVLLAKRLPRAEGQEPRRFIDFASPIVGAEGEFRGIVAAHASWGWVARTVEAKILGVLALDGVDMLVTDQEGHVLYPLDHDQLGALPAGALDEEGPARMLTWADGRTRLTAAASDRLPAQAHLGWRVVLRQAEAAALKTPASAHDQLLPWLIGLSALLLLGLLGQQGFLWLRGRGATSPRPQQVPDSPRQG